MCHQESGLSWLIIIFVVALALAPLSHFVPSKRQREVARMRERAAVSGLFVEFRPVPGEDRVGPAERAAWGDVIYYGKRLPPARSGARSKATWIRRNDGWASIGQHHNLPDSLGPLPGAIIGASVDDGSCGIYWGERVPEGQGESMVDEICRALEAWSTALAE